MPYQRKEFHKEENCLNCGYPLVGKFCAQCGQKAFLHKDSFWHMAMHFAGDYFHYNSKFWTTLKALLFAPGQATLEYIQGKRVKYLNPIQLYIFVTTVFFLFVFMGKGDDHNEKVYNSPISNDTLRIHDQPENTTNGIDSTFLGLQSVPNSKKHVIGIGELTPKEFDVETYEANQKALPDSAKDDFLTYRTRTQYLKLTKRYGGNFTDKYFEIIRHNVPKTFFILLPFFAFLLHIVFYRKRMYYVDHLIFSIHYHSVLFIVLGLITLFDLIITADFYAYFAWFVVTFGLGTYLFLSFRKVYPSPWWKILMKQFFVFGMYFFGFFIMMILLFVVTFLTM